MSTLPTAPQNGGNNQRTDINSRNFSLSARTQNESIVYHPCRQNVERLRQTSSIHSVSTGYVNHNSLPEVQTPRNCENASSSERLRNELLPAAVVVDEDKSFLEASPQVAELGTSEKTTDVFSEVQSSLATKSMETNGMDRSRRFHKRKRTRSGNVIRGND